METIMKSNSRNVFSIIGVVTHKSMVMTTLGRSIRVIAIMNQDNVVSCDFSVGKDSLNITGFKSRDMYKYQFSNIEYHAIIDLPASIYWLDYTKGRRVYGEGKVSAQDFRSMFNPFFLNEVQGVFGIGIHYGDLYNEDEGSVYFGYQKGISIRFLNEYAELGEEVTFGGGVTPDAYQRGSKILNILKIDGSDDTFKDAKEFKNDSFVREVYKSLLENKVSDGKLVIVTAKKFTPDQYTDFDSDFTLAVVRELRLDE